MILLYDLMILFVITAVVTPFCFLIMSLFRWWCAGQMVFEARVDTKTGRNYRVTWFETYPPSSWWLARKRAREHGICGHIFRNISLCDFSRWSDEAERRRAFDVSIFPPREVPIFYSPVNDSWFIRKESSLLVKN